VAFDRVATLRNAEKLLRQGKLEAAIAEYLRIVEDQPRDLNTTNTLGDLYVRAGQVDKAVEQYIRIADRLNDDGFLPKAGALYKKILKLKPDHEHSLVQGAEIAASQGLLADARTYLNAIAERRRARGDKKGVAQAIIRLGSLDPADFEARAAAATARMDIGDLPGAVADLKQLAGELAEAGRQPEAIEALRQAALINPTDEEIRGRLLSVYVAAGDFARARECAVTADQFKSLAAALDAQGHTDDALSALREAARLDPDDAGLRAHLTRTFVARGDLQAAGEYLTVETAGNDPQLLLTVAEIQLRGALADDGLALVRRLLQEDPGRRDAIARVGWTVAEQSPDVGFQVVELAAETAVAQTDWASAAAAIQEFVTRVPNYIPALMRLVEICVDGGLEATMYSAQAQLADAYIAAGSAAEARFIAEDLVAREPWERANIERFRRALVLLGEPDPDGVIAERLSGQSPFTSTDLMVGEEFPPFAAQAPTAEASEAAVVAPPSTPEVGGVSPAPEPAGPPPPQKKRPKQDETSHFELSANAIDIDLDGIYGEPDPPAPVKPAPVKPASVKPAPKPQAHAAQESVEVDLSIVLGDLRPPAQSAAPAPTPAVAASAPLGAGDIDSVFEHLRDEASKRSTGDAAEEQLKRGMAARQAGKIDESIEAFEMASRSPRHRFQAATLIGRSYRERGQMPRAIEWFERAAQAPAPTAEEGHMLLYELADALESVGEVARALAICMELHADAGEYRDVAARVDRLAKEQTRG
jgi:tetratricopeptide (TPR) repeat protein